MPLPATPITEAHRAALVAALHRVLGRLFTVEIELVDQLDRTGAGKLEEFVSRVIA